jgi:hypothetical protein
LKNKLKAKGMGAAAPKVQSPEFKLQSCQKILTKKKKI